MTKRIFRSICIAAASVFVASLAMSIWVLYSYFSELHHDRLESQTKLTAHSLANEGMSFFDGLEAYDYRVTWIDKDGSVIYDTVSGSGDMADHSDRETAGIALLIFDMTDKEKAEQMRREFTANVSHEIKTPLHAISGYAEIMRDGLVKPEDTDEFAGRIYSETQRMIALVDDIIKLSRLDEGADGLMFEETHLLDTARGTVRLLERTAEEMKINISVAGDDVTVISVPHLVSGIIYNLCDNAIKYNRENGSVSVLVKDCGERAQISVSDTGIGIAPEQKERIFERFCRVDKSRSKQVGGTGLGLSIVKHSAAVLGGEIEVESVLNGGTSITVRLPKAGGRGL